MEPTGIYAITNGANGKRYVGSAVHFPARRGQHIRSLRAGKHHSIKLQRAWDKYGEGLFTFDLLLRCKKEDLLFFEQRAIEGFDAVRAGYNVAPLAGSTLGMPVSAEARANLSKAHKGRKKTAEHQANITEALRGKKRAPEEAKRLRDLALGNKHCVGRLLSEASRKRMSEAHMGNAPSALTCEKISKALKGRKRIFTPEHCANIAKAKALKKKLDEVLNIE